MAKHRRNLGAIFDPNKPTKGASFVAGEASTVIANFLGTDKGGERFVFGGCPKDVKDEVEANAKCNFFSNRDSVLVRDGGQLRTVASRTGQGGTIVNVNPGIVNGARMPRAMANAVLRALGAGVQVEDRTLLKTKDRRIGAAVLSTGQGGRVLVTGPLAVPVSAEVLRAAQRAVGAPSSTVIPLDPNSGFEISDIMAAVEAKKASKKRRSRKKSKK